MDSSARPKYCSVATALKAPGCDPAVPPWDLSFTCPFALQAPRYTRHNLFPRCASYPGLHIAHSAWQQPGWLGRVGDATSTWVLARREPDGFYYRAQIKAAPELERQGTLLVEFEAPLDAGSKLPSQRQSVVLKEDVIQLSSSMEYSLRPGDKVLAPWEPDRQRYGPGTVLLGLEMAGTQRASEEEEITVHFWNGKTGRVPRTGAQWVPPPIWKRAVERLHKPSTREHPDPFLCGPYCPLLGTIHGCVTTGLPLGTPFLGPPCYPYSCSQFLCQGCLCCCPWAGSTWWPLTWTSEVTARELPESELKSTAWLLPLEGPKEEKAAVRAPVAISFSSSSSSSSEDDLENELEMGLPQRLMVDSMVNTDPILPEESPRQSGFCRPEWRNKALEHPQREGWQTGESTNHSTDYQAADHESHQHDATTDPARGSGTLKTKSRGCKD
ncbi:uncharacterized protein C11orf16 homolog isoform X2 [Tupaia chinensis]|uniref:uncharacterized protein C11orf16 homolog isoform X2 n=1 Tax=Tupaia chinensis TaxID=246437 RepID=UPI0003C91BB1|nr:uncharacterized protein C11orf16 homolog isoform X2 [Tupaia chinensis]